MSDCKHKGHCTQCFLPIEDLTDRNTVLQRELGRAIQILERDGHTAFSEHFQKVLATGGLEVG